MFEINEGIGGPKLLSDLLAGHSAPRATQKHFEDQIRLSTKFYFGPVFEKFMRGGAQLERTKTVSLPPPHNFPPH
jgi:hypothetical protein